MFPPGFLPLGLIVIGLAFWLFLEQWITGDRHEHHLLDRPRSAPTGQRSGWRGHLLRDHVVAGPRSARKRRAAARGLGRVRERLNQILTESVPPPDGNDHRQTDAPGRTGYPAAPEAECKPPEPDSDRTR